MDFIISTLSGSQPEQVGFVVAESVCVCVCVCVCVLTLLSTAAAAANEAWQLLSSFVSRTRVL